MIDVMIQLQILAKFLELWELTFSFFVVYFQGICIKKKKL